MGSKKIREVIREEKMEKTKAQKELNVEMLIVEYKNNTHKHKSCMIPLLIKTQLWLQIIDWVRLGLSFANSFHNYILLLTAVRRVS